NSALNITGALTLGTLDLIAPSAGVYTLMSGGSITGGSTGLINNAALQFGNGGTLNAVTLSGNFSEPTGGSVTVTGDTLFEGGTTTFASDTVHVGAGNPGLEIASTGTWTGNVSIYAAVGSTSVLNSGTITETTASTNYFYGNGFSNFTINNHGTISATAGTLNLGNTNTDTVNNFGTISTSGGTITFGGGGVNSFVNTGSISATGGGIINLGGSFTTADMGGTFSESGTNSAINISGTLDNTSATLPTASSGVFTLVSGGTISKGIVDAGTLAFGNGGTLAGVDMVGSFVVPSGTTFTSSAASGTSTLFENGTSSFSSNTVHVGAGSPGLTVASNETWTGNFSIYGNAGPVNVVNNGTLTNTSGGGLYYGNSSTAYTFTNNGTITTTGGSLTIGDASTDMVVNTSLIEATGGTTLSVGTPGTVQNSGTLEATGMNSILNLGSGASTWSNLSGAHITAASGGVVNLGGTFATSNLVSGTISESGTNSAINIVGSLANGSAMLNAPNGGGIFTLASGGTITGGVVNGGALTFGNGGTLANVDMNGSFTVPLSATFTVTGATTTTLFENGTTTFAGNIVRVGAGLPGLAINSDEIWTGSFSIYGNTGTVNVVNNGTLTNTSGGGLYYGNSSTAYTFTNNGTITTTGGSLAIGDASTDMVVNTSLIEATGGTTISVGTPGTVQNSGTLEATGMNSILNLGSGASTWSNLSGAHITAASGGVVNLGGTYSTSNLVSGTIAESGTNSAINIVGSLANGSAMLNAPNGGGIFTLASGGTITGGMVNGTALTFGNGGTLANVDMVGSFTVPLSATFNVTGATNTTLFENGTTTFAGNIVRVGAGAPGLALNSDEVWTGSFSIYGNTGTVNVVNNGTLRNTAGGNLYYGNSSTAFTFTNNGTIDVTGGSLTIGDASTDMIFNTSLIEATGGASISVATAGNVQNSGTLEATGMNTVLNIGSGSSTWANLSGGNITALSGGVVNLGGIFATSNLVSGTISESGTNSAINIVGSLANGSATLNAPNGGGIFTLASGGTITGGTVNGTALTFGNGGTLANVDMVGSFTVPTSATFNVTGATTTTLFQGGTTTFAGNIVRVGAGAPGLALNSDEIWTGSFSIYGNTGTVNIVNNGTLRNTAGGNLYYGNSSAAYTFTNNGTIDVTGGSLTIGDASTDVVSNTGTVDAAGFAVTFGLGSSTLTNFSGTTLAGGVWDASAGGTITFSNATHTIATIASGTTVVLDGAASNIYSGTTTTKLEQSLATNSGTLEVLSSRNFAATNAVTNNGTIQLGGGTFSAPSVTNGTSSTLLGTGTFTATSGGFSIGGTAVVAPGTSVANGYVGSMNFNVGSSSSLTLASGGTANFDLVNAGGVAGTGYDTINVIGSGGLLVTATSGSKFNINLETIAPGTGLPGMATFNSSLSYQWTIFSGTSLSGFSPGDFNLNTSAFTNGLAGGSFSLASGSNNIYLDFTPVPEPSTWVLICGGLAVVGFAVGRRRMASRQA
ncbi:MAG TPA: PEP-CTERM sorting domain-containing protein, partial [Opitutaceae bacterium]|nr:PEP-CTERM sorting domain-containing protein [Opitutaceae bacterium]